MKGVAAIVRCRKNKLLSMALVGSLLACRYGIIMLAKPSLSFVSSSASAWRLLQLDRHMQPTRGRALQATEVDLSSPGVQAFLDRHVVNEEETMLQNAFSIPPQKLIILAKYFLATEAPEAQERGDGSMLTDDFRFIGPVIGPLDKEQFLDTVYSVDFFRVFPDATAQFHHFRVDPFEPNRVWYTARGTGLHSGEAEEGSDTAMMFGEPTKLRYKNAPQACSLRFTEEGKVDQFTIGYVMDRCIGNTGGLGGFFGPLYAIGKGFPFEEGKPWQPSLGYQFYVTIGAAFNRLRATLAGKPPKDLIAMPKGTEDIV